MRTRNGFTLIELLVVVAIIVTLLAILMPSMGKALEVTQRTLCATNMKNWGVAALAYAADNDRTFPYNGSPVAGWSPIGGQHISWNSTIVQLWWKNYLMPNQGSASAKSDEHDVLNCPTQTWHQVNDRDWNAETGEWIAGSGGLVGYFWLPGRNPANIDYTPAGNGWVSKTRIGGPDSRAPIMADMKQYNTSSSTWFYNGGAYSSHARESGEADGGNFLFEDTHVTWYQSDTTGNPSNTDPNDVMKLGAQMGGWQFFYKIPLQ